MGAVFVEGEGGERYVVDGGGVVVVGMLLVEMRVLMVRMVLDTMVVDGVGVAGVVVVRGVVIALAVAVETLEEVVETVNVVGTMVIAVVSAGGEYDGRVAITSVDVSTGHVVAEQRSLHISLQFGELVELCEESLLLWQMR